ncbi:hypothetical protein YS40_032 [Thermus phage phiYS40]|uniref:hypothetical protein n=1 Tax=Thermus phage phiYS40 TaxID=407392 RepID=UPI0000E68996|nr:hypothetical protein YS40_032 [Thermus phage phiYS40]ABJ91426.1 hypothetical protein YS40_032 [Thermus phage phiYS40]
MTQFTIDFSNCTCSSELFKVTFEQNKKGISVKIKNQTSSVLNLVIEAYLISTQKYLAKSVSIQANEESLSFFPVPGVDDVIFAIYEKTDDCTMVFDEQTKVLTFTPTKSGVGALCFLSGDDVSLKVFIKGNQVPVSTSFEDTYSVFNINCFCVKMQQ